MPLRHWVPTSIAPSGMAFVTSERYPGWKGNLVMGTLRAQSLVRLTLDGRRITEEQRLLTDMGRRIRDVRQGPDGWLYLLTDGDDGRVIRAGELRIRAGGVPPRPGGPAARRGPLRAEGYCTGAPAAYQRRITSRSASVIWVALFIGMSLSTTVCW
jgi:hypothetical protein